MGGPTWSQRLLPAWLYGSLKHANHSNTVRSWSLWSEIFLTNIMELDFVVKKKKKKVGTNKLQTFSRHCTSFQCHLGWSNVTRTLCLWCPQPISSLNSFCNWLQLVCAFRISQSKFLGVQISCLDLIVLKKILVDEGLELKFCNKNISRLKKYYTAFLLP